MIFDSHYDSYKGVVGYVRVMEGTMHATDMLRLMTTATDIRPVEIGFLRQKCVVMNPSLPGMWVILRPG